MSNNYGNQSAFPVTNYLVNSREDSENEPGLTKLQVAALMIAPAVLANRSVRRIDSPEERSMAAKLIVDMAVRVLEAADNYYKPSNYQ